MAESLVLRLVKDVELNRRSLIQHCRENGVDIRDDVSLDEVVSMNNSIEYEKPEHANQHEIRWFDGDGTLLHSEYVEHGGSVTKPENPNLDPENLTFDKWVSFVGEKYDNITHDIDFGATYKINDNSIHLFCRFTPDTGLDVSIPLYQSQAKQLTIKWGDEQESVKTTSGSTKMSHTYADYGDYEIIISGDPLTNGTNIFYLQTSTSDTSTIFGSKNASMAFEYGYFPLIYPNSTYLTYSRYVVFERAYASSGFSIPNTRFAVVHNLSQTSGTAQTNSGGSSVILSDDISISGRFYTEGILNDKLFIPNISVTIGNMYKAKVLVCNSSSIIFDSPSRVTSNLKSIVMLNNNLTNYPTVSGQSFTSLERISLPFSIKSFSINCFANSKLKYISLPDQCSCQVTSFQLMYFLKNLNLYANFDYSLNIAASDQLTLECLIDMLNKVKDNTSSTSKTLTLHPIVIKECKTNYVVLNNGLWELSDVNNKDAITLLEAFNSKNWTIA